MSSMKGGFSTLNRWFGRKKEKTGVGSAASNGKLSKSTTQLHHMSTDQGMHINEASQLDYNRITPLPAATSNAPFEQTFRITVLLPKDQLYVTRLGARVPLSKLLSLVCDNKQLDADKYEFRNTVDASQVYSCESTIGAVGLSEIRLCHKSESYDSFNADSMLKFQRTVAARDSLSSSSEFSSSRHSHSKLAAKTPSPYSSSNSLNSMDSTGMNYTRTPVVPPKALAVAPPPRKKRVAPRPPSQLVIPEQSVAQFDGSASRTTTTPTEPAYAVIVKRPQLCMSTPNLASTPELDAESDTKSQMAMAMEPETETELDCNGNSAKTPDAADGSHYATLQLKPSAAVAVALPEPTPRKRLLQLKKKAAPAPPPDALGGGSGGAAAAAAADTISLASTTASITEMMPTTPQPAPRITTPIPTVAAAPTTTPTPTPTPTPAPTPTAASPQLPVNGNQNVSKVLLNRTPTPEPRSLGSATEDEDNNDAASKQADSGIGEPVPSSSPEPEQEPELETETEAKSQPELKPETHIESSSEEDEEAIKVYNFKTSSQSSHKAATTLAELSVLNANQETEDELTSDEQRSPTVNGALATPSSASELTSLSSWNYAGPISPPPDFSDCSLPAGKEMVEELASLIQQQRLDTLIRQAPEQPQIEAAKPNRLANFSIAAIGNGNGNGNENRNGNGRGTDTNSSSSSSNNSPRIGRADSFQSPRHSLSLSLGLGLGQRLRSSSQLSLHKCEPNGNGVNLQARRSSSELSIGESPSLQSLELIKTILSNSRKNSLAEITPEERPPQQQQLFPQPEQPEKPKSSPCPTAATANVVTDAPAPAPVSQPAATSLYTATSVTTAASTVPARISPVEQVKPKPTPPTYRYSGPPSINFATWSERPKSQVAIKNEGDYIYGGAKGAPTPGSVPAAAAAPTPTPAAAPAKLTIEVASPILRMGIPRKEYHVPITVRPLRDASQEREEQQQLQPEKQADSQPEPQSQPASEPVLIREPVAVKPTTLPRPTKSNRFTLPAGSGGPVQSGTASNSLPRPSSAQLEKLEKSSATSAEPAAAPFGQNTLRRTGFKERMLAKEQQEKEQALRVRVSVNGMAAPPAPAKPTPAVLRSSKVELEPKLDATEASPPAPTMLQVKLRPTSLMAVKTAAAATPTPTPAPPPAPPMLAKAKPAQRSVNAVKTPTTPDPRNQLLEAIRNFKREELNRA